ncbi:MAG: MFS transporter [Elusimicrobia bacterium]|nr:MFS transporter [Elusimicrobiota bacterium]
MRRIKEFLGLNASMYAMIVLVMFLGLGEKMAERYLPLYLIALGGTAFLAGMLNSLNNFLNAVYSLPGGYAAQRFGYKKSLVFFTLLAMLGYAIVIAIPSWQAVFIGAFFFISWNAVTLPAVMSLVSKTVKADKRTMGVSIHSFVRKIPMALGPIVGGGLIARYGTVLGIRLAFIMALAFSAAALAFMYFKMEDESVPQQEESVFSLFKGIKGPLRNLLLSDTLIRFAEQIPYAFVVLWVVQTCGYTPVQFGFLSALEMVVSMLIYIPVAYLADKSEKKPFVLATFAIFTAFPLALYFSHSMTAMVLVFTLRGLKEFGEPTRKALIMDLAPEGKKAGTFGAYYLIRDVIVSIGAAIGAYLWMISPAVNLITAFACGVIGTLVFAFWGKEVKREAAQG